MAEAQIRVLFVDDDANLLSAITRALRGRFKFETAVGSQQGLETVRGRAGILLWRCSDRGLLRLRDRRGREHGQPPKKRSERGFVLRSDGRSHRLRLRQRNVGRANPAESFRI